MVHNMRRSYIEIKALYNTQCIRLRYYTLKNVRQVFDKLNNILQFIRLSKKILWPIFSEHYMAIQLMYVSLVKVDALRLEISGNVLKSFEKPKGEVFYCSSTHVTSRCNFCINSNTNIEAKKH